MNNCAFFQNVLEKRSFFEFSRRFRVQKVGTVVSIKSVHSLFQSFPHIHILFALKIRAKMFRTQSGRRANQHTGVCGPGTLDRCVPRAGILRWVQTTKASRARASHGGPQKLDTRGAALPEPVKHTRCAGLSAHERCTLRREPTQF